MTRRDLEEVITNLEYLVENHFEPNRVQEYEQQLQTFRSELQALRQEQFSFTAASLGLPWQRHQNRG